MKTRREDENIKEILNMLVNDDTVYCGGITEYEAFIMRRYNMTQKQVGNITYKIWSAIKSLR